MKKPIIACLALACLAPFSNAVVIYDTMTGYGFDEFLSPVSCKVPGADQLAVDDVTLAANMKITSISFRLLSNNEYNIGDILSGYLYIYGSNGDGTLNAANEIFGAGNGLINFTVSQVGTGGFIFDYAFDVNNAPNINLLAGTYWFGIQPYSTNPNVQPFNTAGDNYGKGLNTMVYNGSSWQTFSFQGQGTDLSMRIEAQELGEPAVPGPAAVIPFGLGLAAALRRRRK